VLTSPFSPAECGRRLVAATDPRPPVSFLQIVGTPQSMLVGDVGPSHLRVAQPLRNRRVQPWFEGVVNPARQGGTIVRGTVGLRSAQLVPWRVFSVVVALIVVVMIAAGVESTVSGSAPGPAMLAVPGFVTAFYALAWALTSWQARSESELLVGTLSEILGAVESSPADPSV
jgi:hypothetical protein